MPATDLIGVTEAATMLGYSTRKVKRLAKAGTIEHALKMPGGTGAYLFDRATIAAFAAADTDSESAA